MIIKTDKIAITMHAIREPIIMVLFPVCFEWIFNEFGELVVLTEFVELVMLVEFVELDGKSTIILYLLKVFWHSFVYNKKIDSLLRRGQYYNNLHMNIIE